MAVDYAGNEKIGLESIEAISRAWKFFKAYTNNTIDLSGDTNITQEQMLSMPAGYSHDGSIFGNLVKIYQTRNDTREQNDLLQIENLSDGSMKTGFSYAFGVSLPTDIEKGSLDIIHNEKRGYIEVVGLTQNNDLDTTTIGELFHDLIYHEATTSEAHKKSGSLSVTQRVKNYYDFLKSGKSLEQYMSQSDPDFRTRKIAAYTGTDIDTAGRAFDELLKILDEYSKKFL